MTPAPGERTMGPYHFVVRYGADVYTGFLYPDSGRFSLDCNGSFVGTGHYFFAGGEVHGLGGRHRAAASAIAAALAQHDPDLRSLHHGADDDAPRRQGA